MAVYNAELYISETLESILNQTFRDFEFLIIDDCSTDNTLSIIKSYEDSRINLHCNEKNLGQSPSLNKGICLAKGKYIARMDADDIAFPDRFEKQYNFLESYPEVVVLGSSYRIMGASEVKELNFKPSEIKVRLFLGLNSLAHPTVMIRKEIFSKYNFTYNEYNPVNQDFELWSEISRRYPLANLEDVLLDYRVHDDQISNMRYGEQQEHAKRIITTALQDFFPEICSCNLLNHYRLLGFEKFELSDLENLITWSNILINKNKETAIFEQSIFEEYVHRFQNQRIKQAFNASFILAPGYSPTLYVRFLKAKKRFSPNLDSKVILKFMIKCLLFKTRKTSLS